eukprot:gene20416-27198_t
MGMPGGGGGAKGTDPSNLMRFFESQSNYNLGQAPPMSQAKARPGGGALPTARNVAELEQILGMSRRGGLAHGPKRGGAEADIGTMYIPGEPSYTHQMYMPGGHARTGTLCRSVHHLDMEPGEAVGR